MNPYDPVTQFNEWLAWQNANGNAPATPKTETPKAPPAANTPPPINSTKLPGTAATPPSPTTSTTNYAAQNAAQRRDQLLSTGNYKESPPAGAKPIGTAGNMVTAGGITWHRDNATGLWSPGYATSRTEANLALQAQKGATGGEQNVRGAIAQSALSPSARSGPTIAGAAGMPGTLQSIAGVTVPGMGAYNLPGVGVQQEGLTTLRDNGLNTLYGGRQGSLTQVPVTPGFRGPGQTGNSIAFGQGGSGGGRAEPQMLFDPAVVSVPGTYREYAGNVGDANRALDIPFNIGPGGASTFQLAGNNVQLNSADKSTGTGFALNAMPASNIFATNARQGSNDPALQAAQTLQLMAAQNAGFTPEMLMATNANQFGGFHAGTTNGPNSGNGGTAQGTWFAGAAPGPQAAALADVGPDGQPLQDAQIAPPPPAGGRGMSAPAPTPQLTAAQVAGGITPQTPGYSPNLGGSTNAVAPMQPGAYGPAFGNDAQAALAAAIAQAQKDKDEAGGDNGGRDFVSYSRGGSVKVPGYKSGGNWIADATSNAHGQFKAKAQRAGMSTRAYASKMADAPGKTGKQARLAKTLMGFAAGGSVAVPLGANVVAPVTPGETAPELAAKSAATAAPTTTQAQPLPSTSTEAPVSNQGGASTEPSVNIGQLDMTGLADANALAPFQQAANYEAAKQHARQGQNYIRGLAGLGEATAVPIVSGASGTLGPGQYWDTIGTLNRSISGIADKQAQLREMGANEDYAGTQAKIASLQQQQQPFKQAMGFQTQLQGLGNVGDQATLQAEINALKTQAGPLVAIGDAQQKLAALGPAYDQGEINSLSAQVTAAKAQLQGLGDPNSLDEHGLVYYNMYNSQLQSLQSQLNQMLNRNNAINEAQNTVGNLLKASGMTPDQLAPLLAKYQTDIDLKNTALANANKAAELRAQIAALVGEGVDPSAKYAEISGQLDPLQAAASGILARNTQRQNLATGIQNTVKAGPPLLTGFKKGGSVKVKPKRQMVTPEEIVGVGKNSGKAYFRVGEPRKPGGPPAPELLTIKPLPMRRKVAA